MSVFLWKAVLGRWSGRVNVNDMRAHAYMSNII